MISPKTSTQTNGEIEWRESRIPPSYISSFGSIAVASCKGFCVLDCSRLTSSSYEPQSSSHDDKTSKNDFSGIHNNARTAYPKWSLFGSESEERGFRVLAMTWWEGEVCEAGRSSENFTDDLLLAVIERGEGKLQKMYLACWSRRR
jgi:hypothetical protein